VTTEAEETSIIKIRYQEKSSENTAESVATVESCND
jgi:hypothetical protein